MHGIPFKGKSHRIGSGSVTQSNVLKYSFLCIGKCETASKSFNVAKPGLGSITAQCRGPLFPITVPLVPSATCGHRYGLANSGTEDL